MEDCAAILALAARAAGTTRFVFRDRAIDPVRRARAVDGGGGVLRATPASTSRRCWRRRRRAQFAAAARAVGIRVAGDDTWGDIFSRVLVEKIEPRLGCERATILYEYPAVQSPLARPKASDPRLAERFELYACGVELANGFGELTDATEQRRRLEAADGREGAHLRRALSDRRGLSARRLPQCRPRAGSRSDSIAWSCWRPARPASSRCCGRRSPSSEIVDDKKRWKEMPCSCSITTTCRSARRRSESASPRRGSNGRAVISFCAPASTSSPGTSSSTGAPWCRR